MQPRFVFTAAVAALLLTSARAADAPPDAAGARATDVTPDSHEALAARWPMAGALASRFDGERVFAIVDPRARMPERPVPPSSDAELLHRLQAFCEGFTTDARPIAPFAVRGTWVVAPLTRDEVELDMSGLSPLDVLGRAALLQRAVAETPAEDAGKLGSAEGIAATDLTPAARDALMRALRPPLKVYTVSRQGGYYGFSMSPDQRPQSVVLTDPRGIRLRAWLRSNGIQMNREDGRSAAIAAALTVTGEHRVFDPLSPAWMQKVVLPASRGVPNSFKPSDLDGKALRAPLGFHGTFPLRDFLDRLSHTSGLDLRASAQYHDALVFAGSDRVTVGEALDGMRLALTAAWRKMGDMYLLTWDRRGFGVLDAFLTERTAALQQATLREDRDTRNSLLMELSLTLPFAPADPLPWTDTQRQKLFKVTFEPPGSRFPFRPVETKVTYAEMTPAQREAARHAEEQGLSETTGKPLPRLDAGNATLNPVLTLEISVYVPSVGWVAPSMPVEFDVRMLRSAAIDLKITEANRRREGQPRWTSPPVEPSTPLYPANQRALIVPALDAETLARVLGAMKSKGFTALFYPAFTDGCATFPTNAFPQLPALKGRDALGDAVRLARENGIAVAAVVESMAWRAPGATGHWTDSAPGWLGRDVLGRTLTEFIAAAQPVRSGKPVEARGDVARLRPGTRERLIDLLGDLARRPGVQGVLFDAWSPETIVRPAANFPRGSFQYAVPSRMAAIREDSVDPVDRQTSGYLRPADALAIAPPPETAQDARRGQPTRSMPPADLARLRTATSFSAPVEPYEALLTDLLKTTKARAKGWKTYATKTSETSRLTPGAPQPQISGADAVLALSGFSQDMRPRYALIHVPPGSSLAAAEFADHPLRFLEPPHLIVYDFRDAPNGIVAALQAAVLP